MEVNERKIAQFINQLKGTPWEIHAAVIFQNGQQIFSQAFAPYDLNTVHPLYSVTKSFTSMAFGFLKQEQCLDLDSPWLSFFPEYDSEAVPEFSQVTLRHLLTMTMGQDHEVVVRPGDDWIAEIVRTHCAYPPGTHFFYNSMCSYLIGRFVEKMTGLSLEEYLKPRLFQSLGIKNWYWEKDESGHNHGGFGLHLKTTDLARFGQCLLDHGMYQGRQILPKTWLEKATQKQVDTSAAYPDTRQENRMGYGYYFWRCSHHAYRCSGLHGQMCFVQPENHLVVALASAASGSQVLLDSLFSAFDTPQEENLSIPDSVPFPVGKAHSCFEREYLFSSYAAQKNPADVKQVSLRMKENHLLILLEKEGQRYEINAAWEKWNQQNDTLNDYSTFYLHEAMLDSPPLGEKRILFARYAWITDTELCVEARRSDCSAAYQWLFIFDHRYLTMKYEVKALLTYLPQYTVIFQKE